MTGIAALLFASAALFAAWQRYGWLRSKVRRRIMVSTTEGISLDGCLRRITNDGLILEAARLHSDDSPPVSLSGETFVPRGKILLVQILPPNDPAG